MTCTHRDMSTPDFELDLEGASLTQLRALFAALALDSLGHDEALFAQLRSIVAGAPPDRDTLEQCWDGMYKDVDEYTWYDGGFCEQYTHVRHVVEVLAHGDHDTTLWACRRMVARLFREWSHGRFWGALHANHYCVDHERAQAEAASGARDALERRWSEIRG